MTHKALPDGFDHLLRAFADDLTEIAKGRMSAEAAHYTLICTAARLRNMSRWAERKEA